MKRPMVVLDGRPLQAGFKAHQKRGIGRYAKNLISSLTDADPAFACELILQEDLADPGIIPQAPRILSPSAPAWLPFGKRFLTYHYLMHRSLARAWKEGKVVHFLSHLDAPALVGPRTVITVHDLIFQRLSQTYRAGRISLGFMAKRWLETRCLSQAARVIAVSSRTRRDLVEILGLDPRRIEVIPEASDPVMAPQKDPARIAEALALHGLSLDHPFFLYVGGIDKRKGLDVLLQAIQSLQRQGLPHGLALAGDIGKDPQHPHLISMIRELDLQDRVKLLGYVSDDDLRSLFAACLAFVFPSFYEGFGLPPLEAMSCGAPVLAARAGAVPEVVGEAGLLVAPGNPGELAQAMASLIKNPHLGEDLRERGFKQAARFSWPYAAVKTKEVYQEVAGGG